MGMRVGAPEAELTRNPGIARCLLATKAPAFGKPRFAQTVAQQPVAAAQLKPALESMHHEAANERVLLPINRARPFGGTSAHRKTHPFTVHIEPDTPQGLTVGFLEKKVCRIYLATSVVDACGIPA